MIRPMSEYGQFVHDAFQFRNTHNEPGTPAITAVNWRWQGPATKASGTTADPVP